MTPLKHVSDGETGLAPLRGKEKAADSPAGKRANRTLPECAPSLRFAKFERFGNKRVLHHAGMVFDQDLAN